MTPTGIYQQFEKDNMQYIAWEGEAIGVFSKLKETWPDDNKMQQWCDYFIRIAQYEIENITEEIEDDRRTIAEITGI